MKCGVYCRVSTELQKDNFSVEIQKERGIRFASSNGYEYTTYLDVESGSTNNRPAFSKLIKDIEEDRIHVVWVIEFTRLSRNDEEDSLFIRRLFVEKEVRLYENGSLIAFDSPEDKLFYSIRSSVAAYERRKIRERMTNGLNQRYSKGGKINPRVYGYDYKNGNLTINEDEAEVIRQIFQSVIDGKTYSQIAEDLILRGKRRKMGGINWTSGVITKLLRQTLYHGLIKSPDGKLIQSAYYPPIVTDELWTKSRVKLKEKKNYTEKLKMRKGQFELSGFLSCSKCGARFFRKHNGKHGFYIHATSGERMIECKKTIKPKTIDENTLLYLVRAIYLENFEDYEAIKGFYADEISKIEAENKDVRSKIEDMENNKKKLLQGKNRLIQAVMDGNLSGDDIKDKRKEIDDRIELIDIEIKSLSQVITDSKNFLEALDDFTEDEVLEFYDLPQQKRKAIYMNRIRSIKTVDLELVVEFINNRTVLIPNIYKLSEFWEGRVQMLTVYEQS